MKGLIYQTKSSTLKLNCQATCSTYGVTLAFETTKIPLPDAILLWHTGRNKSTIIDFVEQFSSKIISFQLFDVLTEFSSAATTLAPISDTLMAGVPRWEENKTIPI